MYLMLLLSKQEADLLYKDIHLKSEVADSPLNTRGPASVGNVINLG
jgi:hypothetical protein